MVLQLGPCQWEILACSHPAGIWSRAGLRLPKSIPNSLYLPARTYIPNILQAPKTLPHEDQAFKCLYSNCKSAKCHFSQGLKELQESSSAESEEYLHNVKGEGTKRGKIKVRKN